MGALSKRELNVDAQKASFDAKCLIRVKFSGTKLCTKYHDNVVGCTTCWFEDNKLYMQMELCDRSLSFNVSLRPSAEGDLLEAMHQAEGDLLEAMHQGCPICTNLGSQSNKVWSSLKKLPSLQGL
ncbi:hypothetical protein Tco_1152619 [Tanacetum coccineum]